MYFFTFNTLSPFAEEFVHLQQHLQGYIVNCGYIEKEVYWKILHNADVVVSTAKHEFFGVSV